MNTLNKLLNKTYSKVFLLFHPEKWLLFILLPCIRVPLPFKKIISRIVLVALPISENWIEVEEGKPSGSVVKCKIRNKFQKFSFIVTVFSKSLVHCLKVGLTTTLESILLRHWILFIGYHKFWHLVNGFEHWILFR